MTPDDRLALARLATSVADNAAARHQWPLAGLLRQCARAILEGNPPAEARCRGCGNPLTGRQRQWCSDRCRMFASRSRSASSVP